MEGFFEWLSTMWQTVQDVFSSIFILVGNLVGGLFDFLKVLPNVITMLSSSIANLPDIVLPFATISITVAIVLLIIGRSNNS